MLKISYKHRCIIVTQNNGISIYNLDTLKLMYQLFESEFKNALSVEIESNYDGMDSEALFIGCKSPNRILKIDFSYTILKGSATIIEKLNLGSYPYFLKVINANMLPKFKKICNLNRNVLIVGETGNETHSLEIFDTNLLKQLYSFDEPSFGDINSNHHGIMGIDVNDCGAIVMHIYSTSTLAWLEEKISKQTKLEMKSAENEPFKRFNWGRGIVIEQESQKIIIATTESNMVTVTDREGKVISTHPIPKRPSGLCLNRENGQLLVACQETGVEIFD